MWWNEDRTTVGFRLSAGGFLSWTFRGYDAFVLVVALGPVFDSLLSPVIGSTRPFYAGIALGVTLLGWAVGGTVGGFTDRFLGHRNTATYALLGYSVFMVATALSQSVAVFIGFRFLTSVFLGAEGERGTVFLPTIHPGDRHARNGGSVYAGFGVGVVLASLAWFVLQSTTPEFLSSVLGTEPWRYLFALGVIPVVFVLYLRHTATPTEENRDSQVDPETPIANRGSDANADSASDSGSGSDSLSFFDLFGRTSLRGRIAVGVGAVFAAVAGWWGVTAWLPLFATTIATDFGFANPGRWAAIAGVCFGGGAIAGSVTIEPLADRVGRLGSLLVAFLGSFITVEVIVLLIRTPYVLVVAIAIAGFFAGGGIGWLHVYLPELFPRAVRTAGLESVFALGRLCGFVVPIVIGYEMMVFNAATSVLAVAGALYAVGILVAMYLPNGMARPFDEQG